MKRAEREALDTLLTYMWEDKFIPEGARLTLKAAKALAIRVWLYAEVNMYHTRADTNPPPRIIFANSYTKVSRGGHDYYHYDQSYCRWPEGDIVLMPLDRCRRVLIHELTHALGYGTHGQEFREVYALLLFEFL